jgi:hypothetical protein
MFHRIIHDHWTSIVPIVAFALTFTVFMGVLVRTIMMKKEKLDHLASLPLQNDTQQKR